MYYIDSQEESKAAEDRNRAAQQRIPAKPQRNSNYSAMHLGFTQLTLLTAAYAAKSSIRAKRPMSEKDKTSMQASLRRVFALLSRMAE